mmetsp:Transcript_4794/g.8675  ORF Transcript_4794/g.8675 Transcript_4794/m.8675 type:complete len:298 (+) Transcript_4794:555-1448(+)
MQRRAVLGVRGVGVRAAADEEDGGREVAVLHCHVQRRPVRGVPACRDVGPPLHQGGDHGMLALGHGAEQKAAVLRAGPQHAGPVGDEQVHQLEVVVVQRHLQRRLPGCVLRVHLRHLGRHLLRLVLLALLGAPLASLLVLQLLQLAGVEGEQRRRRLQVPHPGGLVEGGAPLLVGDRRVGLPGQQHGNHFRAAPMGGLVEGRAALMVLVVDLGHSRVHRLWVRDFPGVQHEVQDARVLAAGGPVQGRVAHRVHEVGRRVLLQQQLRQVPGPVEDGVLEGGQAPAPAGVQVGPSAGQS